MQPLSAETKKRILGEIVTHFTQEATRPGASAEEKSEFQRLATVFRFFPARPYEKTDFVWAGSLMRLELGSRSALYFLVPQGGGLILAVDGEPVQVITDQSPLGSALLGRHMGDSVEVPNRAEKRTYRLVDHV